MDKLFIYSTIYICCLLMIPRLTCHAQVNKYVQPSLTYTTDIAANFTGGNKQGAQYMGLINAGASFNSDSAKWWKGGVFNFEIISTHGKGISNTNLQDLQGISNIEAGNHLLLLWELWYYQQFGRLGIRGGLQNINSDFMNQPYIDAFSCSSYGLFPTLASNYSLASYPTAGLGISFTYKIGKNWNVLTSVFDGAVSDIRHDRFNTKWRINVKKDGVLSVSELKYTAGASKNLYSTFALGAAFHNKPFSSIANKEKKYANNYTFYGFVEHDIYRSSTKNAGVFLQASYSPQNRNIAYGYASVGFVMNGFFTSSHTDKTGIGLTQLYFQELNENKQINKRLENTIEAFFLFQINKYIGIKPSLFAIISAPKTTSTAAMFRIYISVF